MHWRLFGGAPLLVMAMLCVAACGGGGGPAPAAKVPNTPAGPTSTPLADLPVPQWTEVSAGQQMETKHDYFVALPDGKLWRLDPGRGGPEGVAGAAFLTWSSGGNAVMSLAVAGRSQVSVAIPGESPTPLFPTSDRAFGLTFSPDGRALAISGDQIIDLRSKRTLATLTEPAATIIGWSADSRFLLLRKSTETTSLIVWDTRTGSTKTIQAFTGTWSHSGARLAYSVNVIPKTPTDSRPPAELRIRDFQTGKDSNLMALPGAFLGVLDWSADDTYLAASVDTADQRSRTLVVAVANPTRGFSVTGSWPAWPAGWSAKDNTLLLTGNVCTIFDTFDVFTVQADGTMLRNWTNSPETDIDPSWSPDGQHVVFPTYSTDRTVLSEIDSPQGVRRQLVSVPTGQQLTVRGWSPDGRYFAFSYGGGRGICEGVHPENTAVGPLP